MSSNLSPDWFIFDSNSDSPGPILCTNFWSGLEFCGGFSTIGNFWSHPQDEFLDFTTKSGPCVEASGAFRRLLEASWRHRSLHLTAPMSQTLILLANFHRKSMGGPLEASFWT